MTRAINYIAALAMALLLAASYHLDGPEDHQGEYAQTDTLKALQASQGYTARRQAAAQALCTEARGPNSEARFTVEGHLVCTTRRGLVAQGQ